MAEQAGREARGEGGVFQKGRGEVEGTWAGTQQDALGRTLLRSWQHYTEAPTLQETQQFNVT